MMFSQGRHPSDSDSVSSETSDVTSRATTLPDTWSDVTPQYQGNIQPIEDDQSSIPSSMPESVSTVIDKNAKIERTNTNQTNTQSQQQQQQQQEPWVNSHWNSDWKPDTKVGQTETNTNTSDANISQLIPGSILINDQGEIDDLSWKNTHSKGSASDNSFNPGGKYVADDSGGPGGYLAPTHIQRRIVTSSPGLPTNPDTQSNFKRSGSSSTASLQGRPTFSRQQTFPEAANNNIQPWVNPYWPKQNEANTSSTQINNTARNGLTSSFADSKQDSRIDSYSGVKPPAMSTSLTETRTHKTSAATQQQEQQLRISPRKGADAFEKGNGDAQLSNSLSFEYKVTPVPSFYERIYPPNVQASPPISDSNVKIEGQIPNQPFDDNEDIPYTIDSQGIAHYRPAVSSQSMTNKTTTLASQSASSEYPPPLSGEAHKSVTVSDTSNPAPFLPKNRDDVSSHSNNIISSLITHSNSSQLLSYNYFPSSSSSVAILTEADLNNIQHAFRLLETNPNAIPTIETPQQTPLHDVNHANSPVSPLASLFTLNKEQQHSQTSPSLPTSSSIVATNMQLNPATYTYTANAQQSPFFSSPSYPSNSDDISHHLTTQGSIVLI